MPTSNWGRQGPWPPEGAEKSKAAKPKVEKLSHSEVLGLSKSEQIDELKKLGISASEILKLNTEGKRVKKIMEVQ